MNNEQEMVTEDGVRVTEDGVRQSVREVTVLRRVRGLQHERLFEVPVLLKALQNLDPTIPTTAVVHVQTCDYDDSPAVVRVEWFELLGAAEE